MEVAILVVGIVVAIGIIGLITVELEVKVCVVVEVGILRCIGVADPTRQVHSLCVQCWL